MEKLQNLKVRLIDPTDINALDIAQYDTPIILDYELEDKDGSDAVYDVMWYVVRPDGQQYEALGDGSQVILPPDTTNVPGIIKIIAVAKDLPSGQNQVGSWYARVSKSLLKPVSDTGEGVSTVDLSNYYTKEEVDSMLTGTNLKSYDVDMPSMPPLPGEQTPLHKAIFENGLGEYTTYGSPFQLPPYLAYISEDGLTAIGYKTSEDSIIENPINPPIPLDQLPNLNYTVFDTSNNVIKEHTFDPNIKNKVGVMAVFAESETSYYAMSTPVDSITGRLQAEPMIRVITKP